MKESDENKKNQLTRRGFLPLIGGSLMLPLLGFAKPVENIIPEAEEEYQTLLKPDGTTVKVKKSVVSQSKIVEKSISNKSLLEWLKNTK